jgi:uncharacterized protein
MSEVNLDSLKAELEELKRNDGWANLFTGLGGKMDKRDKTHYGIHSILTDEELHNIYLGDGIGSRIIDIVADDMTREWVDLTPEDSEDKAEEERADEIEGVLEDLGAETAFNLALKWKRLYGGSLIIIGAQDGQLMDAPLRTNTIRLIDGLKVIDRTDVFISSSEFQTDPSLPGFGQPIRFKVLFHVGATDIYQMVHVSRCIVLKGKPISHNASKYFSIEQRFWGMSELQPVYESLRDFGGISDSIANILYELIIGKFQMEGLAEKLASGEEKQIMDRVMIMSMTKSILHGILLDKDENYTRDTASVAGIADVMDKYMMKVSGTSGIPLTRLFGRQASGMNNKGEAEEGIYYDMTRSKQKTELKPALKNLIDLVKIWKKNQLSVLIKFNPLFQLTELDQANVKKTEAEAAAQKANMYNTYITANVLTPEDAFNQEWADKLGEREFPDEDEPSPEDLAILNSTGSPEDELGGNPNPPALPEGGKVNGK